MKVTVSDPLVTDLKMGVPEAVEVWYKQYHDTILRFVQQKLNSREDAEEITREIFVNALRQLPLFRQDSSLKTWMLRIAAHEIADYYRRRYAKKFIHALPLSHLLFTEDPQGMHETSQLVIQTLNSLRADYREVLLMKYVDNISVRDMAHVLQRSLKSVESDLFRARKEFRHLYAELVAATDGV